MGPKGYEPATRVVDHEPIAHVYRWAAFITRNWRLIVPIIAMLIILIGTYVFCIYGPGISFDGPITH